MCDCYLMLKVLHDMEEIKKCLGLKAFVLLGQRKTYLERSERQREETELAGAVIYKTKNIMGSLRQMRILCLGWGKMPSQGEFMLCLNWLGEDGGGQRTHPITTFSQ